MTAPQPGADASKDEWRNWARLVRAELDWEAATVAIDDSLVAWGPLRSATMVLTYLPMAAEVNLQPLLESDLPCRWVTTRTPETGRMLTLHELGGPLEVHAYGYLQPHASAPQVDPLDIDVMLVPGLAFDLWGNRLGRGAGYYDRLLTMARPDALLVGIVPVALVVDRLPAGAHDVPMTHLATEEGVIETARP